MLSRDNYKELLPLKDKIEEAINILINAYNNNGKILICGNGGSSSDSAHIVGELMKGFNLKREIEVAGFKLQKGIPAIDLTSQSALLSAFCNDCDPSLIYAQEVLAYGSKSKNDVLICLSTSGNSKNVVNACKVAKEIGLKVISLTGAKESELSKLSNVTLNAPSTETFRVQEYHLPIYHYICARVEEYLFN